METPVSGLVGRNPRRQVNLARVPLGGNVAVGTWSEASDIKVAHPFAGLKAFSPRAPWVQGTGDMRALTRRARKSHKSLRSPSASDQGACRGPARTTATAPYQESELNPMSDVQSNDG